MDSVVYCFDICHRSPPPSHRPNRSGLQPRHRELGAAQPAGAAAVSLPPDGGANHLPHLHRQPHQAGLPVRTRLLHRLQCRAQDLPHLPADHPRADPAICLSISVLSAVTDPNRMSAGAGEKRGWKGAEVISLKTRRRISACRTLPLHPPTPSDRTLTQPIGCFTIRRCVTSLRVYCLLHFEYFPT